MSAPGTRDPSPRSPAIAVGPQEDGGRRSGRRPGEGSTRAGILEAALASFAEHGYDRATIRDIGARAAVDPALVIHYFGSKEALFNEALKLPLQPGEVLARGMAAGPDHIGATVVRTFLESWEPPDMRVRLMAMLRSALTNEAAMGMLRDFLVREVFGPITEALGVPDAQLRATLVGSQFIGLSIMRYIGNIEPLASASVDQLVAAVEPTVQRYLMGDLKAPGETTAALAGSVSEAPTAAGRPAS